MKGLLVKCWVFVSCSKCRYKGTDSATGELIALKVAPASDLKHLKNEFALQRMCHHENIVALRDCFLWKDNLWVENKKSL